MGASYLCYVLSNTVTSVYVGSAGLLWLWSERNGTAAEVGGLPEAARVELQMPPLPAAQAPAPLLQSIFNFSAANLAFFAV